MENACPPPLSFTVFTLAQLSAHYRFRAAIFLFFFLLHNAVIPLTVSPPPPDPPTVFLYFLFGNNKRIMSVARRSDRQNYRERANGRWQTGVSVVRQRSRRFPRSIVYLSVYCLNNTRAHKSWVSKNNVCGVFVSHLTYLFTRTCVRSVDDRL